MSLNLRDGPIRLAHRSVARRLHERSPVCADVLSHPLQGESQSY